VEGTNDLKPKPKSKAKPKGLNDFLKKGQASSKQEQEDYLQMPM
jgi:hypothetical protein